MQGVITSVVGEEGPPATLAMLRSSRFLAYADRTGHGPLPPSADSLVQPTGTFPAQSPAEQPIAALHSGEDLEASSGAEADGDAGTGVDPADECSHGQASEPEDAMSEDHTSIAIYEAALSAEVDDAAASDASGCASSCAGSPAASDHMEPQLPPMVRCASPPPAATRPPHAASQRHHMSSAVPLPSSAAYSDRVHVCSSSSAGSLPHGSLSSAASPQSITKAASPPPPSPSSCDASASLAAPAGTQGAEAPCASAGPCDAVVPDNALIQLGSDTGGSSGVDPVTARCPALAHVDAVRTVVEHQGVSLHYSPDAVASLQPPSEQDQYLTPARGHLRRDMRSSDMRSLGGSGGDALPTGSSPQDVPEHRGLPEAGAVPGCISAVL